MDIFTYIIYFLEVSLLNYWYYSISKTLVNPFSCLSLPFTIVLVVCLIFNEYLGFIPFRYEGLWPWIFGLFLFWVPSYFVFLNKKVYSVLYNQLFKIRNINVVFILFLLCIVYMSFNLTHISNLDFGSKDLGEELSVGGLKGRSSNLLLTIFPFLVCYSYNRIIKIVFIVLSAYLLFAIGSKTWILYAILTSMICLYINRKININIWWFTVSFVFMICVFVAYYYVNTDFEDISLFMSFVIRHFYFYFTSGILPLGEICYLEHYGNEQFILPFINLINVWSGYDSVLQHSSIWVATDIQYGTSSNVFTFFGFLLLGENYFGFIFNSLLFGLISSLLFYNSQKNSNIFLVIANGYNLSLLCFGWFNCGYGLLRIWEIIIYSLLLYYLTRNRLLPKGLSVSKNDI